MRYLAWFASSLFNAEFCEIRLRPLDVKPDPGNFCHRWWQSKFKRLIVDSRLGQMAVQIEVDGNIKRVHRLKICGNFCLIAHVLPTANEGHMLIHADGRSNFQRTVVGGLGTKHDRRIASLALFLITAVRRSEYCPASDWLTSFLDRQTLAGSFQAKS